MTPMDRFYVSDASDERGRLHLYPDCRFLGRAQVREATADERRMRQLCIACERRRRLERLGKELAHAT
ncbi:hypothetical protein [Symbiobacterium terraclitae]|uniref:hypothetical protein n=1 Tax=Symbiobacterium terraclitae TaxID=557451 RepID=UPI0035B553FC